VELPFNWVNPRRSIMKHMRKLTLIFLLIGAVLLAACGGEETVSHGETVTDYISLVDALRAEGATVEPAGAVSQPFFSVEGQLIRVDGQDVQVFEYQDEETAQSQAELVSPDGTSVGTSMMTWVEPPHFYQKGSLIVLYVGSSEEVRSALEAVLGPQFAGME
jgi:hypothetical protein